MSENNQFGSSQDAEVKGGVFGNLPLLTLVPAGALVLFIYGIYGIRKVWKCVETLNENELDQNSTETVDTRNVLLNDANIYAGATGFNMAILLVTMVPAGIIRPMSFLMFAGLLLWIIGQSLYYVSKIDVVSEKKAYDKLAVLKVSLWGYLGGAIGVFLGMALVNGMAAYGYTSQLRAVLFLVAVQLIIVNVNSIMTADVCVNINNKIVDEDEKTKRQNDIELFRQFQYWPLGISIVSLVGIVIWFSMDKSKEISGDVTK